MNKNEKQILLHDLMNKKQKAFMKFWMQNHFSKFVGALLVICVEKEMDVVCEYLKICDQWIGTDFVKYVNGSISKLGYKEDVELVVGNGIKEKSIFSVNEAKRNSIDIDLSAGAHIFQKWVENKDDGKFYYFDDNLSVNNVEQIFKTKNNNLYKLKGKFDGLKIDSNGRLVLLEIKKRKINKENLSDYNMTQILCYLLLLNIDSYIVVEQFENEINDKKVGENLNNEKNEFKEKVDNFVDFYHQFIVNTDTQIQTFAEYLNSPNSHECIIVEANLTEHFNNKPCYCINGIIKNIAPYFTNKNNKKITITQLNEEKDYEIIVWEELSGILTGLEVSFKVIIHQLLYDQKYKNFKVSSETKINILKD